MNTPWDFAYLVPHARFRKAYESEYVAFVPPHDERIKHLAETKPAIKKLVSSFTNQFGQPIEPSALLIRSDAPFARAEEFDSVASFRNALAISCIIDAHVLKLSGGCANCPLWSDYFDFYPFTASRNGDQLCARSAASDSIVGQQRAAVCLDDFRGQSAPHLLIGQSLCFEIDRSVWDGCLQSWKQRFVEKSKIRKLRVLFRSLEIAYQASRVPGIGTRTPTIHEFGVGIALWISALEILTHPGSENGKADLKTVLDLLGNAVWDNGKLKYKRYRIRIRKNERIGGTFIQKLYSELYRARNDFLHGNDVTHQNLYPVKNTAGPMLLQCAPLIYRAALMAFLKSGRPQAKNGELESLLEAALEHRKRQSSYEQAVDACRTCLYPSQ